MIYIDRKLDILLVVNGIVLSLRATKYWRLIKWAKFGINYMNNLSYHSWSKFDSRRTLTFSTLLVHPQYLASSSTNYLLWCRCGLTIETISFQI